MSGSLVGPPVFNTGERRSAPLAGSIPVHLRHPRRPPVGACHRARTVPAGCLSGVALAVFSSAEGPTGTAFSALSRRTHPDLAVRVRGLVARHGGRRRALRAEPSTPPGRRSCGHVLPPRSSSPGLITPTGVSRRHPGRPVPAVGVQQRMVVLAEEPACLVTVRVPSHPWLAPTLPVSVSSVTGGAGGRPGGQGALPATWFQVQRPRHRRWRVLRVRATPRSCRPR